MLRISLEVDQRLASWLAREVDKLYPDRNTSIWSWHKQSEQFNYHAIQAQHHSTVVPFASLALSSCTENYNLTFPPLFCFLPLQSTQSSTRSSGSAFLRTNCKTERFFYLFAQPGLSQNRLAFQIRHRKLSKAHRP